MYEQDKARKPQGKHSGQLFQASSFWDGQLLSAEMMSTTSGRSTALQRMIGARALCKPRL